ncbi:class I SAM-dependent methyltransferase [Brachyspira aalborgi]|uniref:class I SAM-dependent methyltransferase n=1 Tax=Brachyspira aalborgi TaxID=29522 RepID=UPI00266663E3|nr:class I SAM-dependent methyltransferase [Brachyspira aalborgi]
MDNFKIYNNRYKSHNDSYNYSGGIKWAFSLIKDIIKYCDKKDIENILDIGCGEGSKSFILANYFSNAKVLGIDFTDEGIKKANNNYSEVNNLYFKKADIFEIQTEKYDMVSCLEVLEHIEDWQIVLKNICNISNKYILISVPTGRMRDYEKYVGHLRNFKKGEIENFVANNGFKKIKTFYAGFPFYSPLGRDWLNRNYKGYDESVSGNFTKKQKLFHYMLYILFRYFCFRNIGDSFIGLFVRK